MSDNQSDAIVTGAPSVPGLSGTPAVAMPQKADLIAKISASTGMKPEVIEMIKNTFASQLTWTELEAGLFICNKRKLDPMQKQISFIKFGGKMTIHVTIDGLRTLAARSGNYCGSTITYIYDVDGKNVESEFPPTSTAKLVGSRAKVYKRIGDHIGEFAALAMASEYLADATGGNNKKMPHVMLAKDAEALALRKGWPEDLSGLYEEAEFDNVITAKA